MINPSQELLHADFSARFLRPAPQWPAGHLAGPDALGVCRLRPLHRHAGAGRAGARAGLAFGTATRGIDRDVRASLARRADRDGAAGGDPGRAGRRLAGGHGVLAGR
ncbi:hypothetical protein G6F22_018034 [Rhizopus arrhizus]|nr:hypothetical protein G6F22_018034 [Rhizopus arrhizus]